MKYFFTKDAARYAGVSEAVFRARARKLGLKPVLMNRADFGWTLEQADAVAAHKPQRAKKGGVA